MLLKEIIDEHGHIIFNGNGYSEEWHQEAAERGLPNLKTTPDALPAITYPEVVEVFEKYGVLSEQELHSRQEIYAEQYCAALNVEANLTKEIGRTVIFPVALAYAKQLADSAAVLGGVGSAMVTKVKTQLVELENSLDALEVAHANAGSDPRVWLDTVLPPMAKARAAVDALEALVPDQDWPLPTYQEMLFIK
jgi:glutamine synthetase